MRLNEKDFKQNLSVMSTKIRWLYHSILNLTPLPWGLMWRDTFLYHS